PGLGSGRRARLWRGGLFGFRQRRRELVMADVEPLDDALRGPRQDAFSLIAQLGCADDDQGGVACVEGLAELLDVGPRHALPQVPGQTAGDAADDRAPDERRREQKAEGGAYADPRPGPVLGRLLVLVERHGALSVLFDDGCVVGADPA